MNRTLKLFLIVSALLLLTSPVSAWWDADYLYRQEITISDPPSVSDFQAPFTITYNAHMDADFADIRFVDDDDTTELDYWIESYTASTSATGYVELADTGSTIYLYYGKSGAVSASDGDATFLFFDDFNDGSIDAGKWTTLAKSTETADETAGNLRIQVVSSQSGGGVISVTPLSSGDYVVESLVYREVAGNAGEPGCFVGLSEATGTSSDYGFKYPMSGSWIYVRTGTSRRMNTLHDGDDTPDGTYGSSATIPAFLGYWIHTTATIDNTNHDSYGTFVFNSNEYGVDHTTETTSLSTLYIHLYYAEYNQAGHYAYFDWVLVRKYSATEPSLAYGSEEGAPATPTPTPTTTAVDTNKYPDRPAASTTVALPDNASYELLLDFLGSGESWNETSGAGAMNWTALLEAIYYPYNAVFGSLAGVLIFAIPFMMGWIRQRDMTVPGIVGIIFGAFIVLMLPAAYHIVAWTFIAFSVTAVIYSLLKE